MSFLSFFSFSHLAEAEFWKTKPQTQLFPRRNVLSKIISIEADSGCPFVHLRYKPSCSLFPASGATEQPDSFWLLSKITFFKWGFFVLFCSFTLQKIPSRTFKIKNHVLGLMKYLKFLVKKRVFDSLLFSLSSRKGHTELNLNLRSCHF